MHERASSCETVGELLDVLACPECQGTLTIDSGCLRCAGCKRTYALGDGIPDFLVGGSPQLEAEIEVQDRVAAFYENVRYGKWYSKKYHELWNEWILADLRPCHNLLDLGCGTGWISRHARAERRIGVDVSLGMLREARLHGCQVLRADAARLPLRSGSIDAVVCRSLLHHLERPELAVAEIARVLRAGGSAVFLDTNRSILSAIPRWLAYRGEHFSRLHQNMSARHLQQLVSKHLDIQRVRFFGYLAYPVLGFPDICDAFRFAPCKRTIFSALLELDKLVGNIPLLNRQSWGVILYCKSRGALSE